MRHTDDIEIDPPQDPTCEQLTRLGDALDGAEFVALDAELLRKNANFTRAEYGARYLPPDAHRSHYYFKLDMPAHLAVSAYRTALTFSKPLPSVITDLREARARFCACAEEFYSRCEWRGADVQWSDGGKFVSLRTILDLEHAMVTARADLDKIEQQVCTPIVRRLPRRRASVRSESYE